MTLVLVNLIPLRPIKTAHKTSAGSKGHTYLYIHKPGQVNSVMDRRSKHSRSIESARQEDWVVRFWNGLDREGRCVFSLLLNTNETDHWSGVCLERLTDVRFIHKLPASRATHRSSTVSTVASSRHSSRVS